MFCVYKQVHSGVPALLALVPSCVPIIYFHAMETQGQGSDLAAAKAVETHGKCTLFAA